MKHNSTYDVKAQKFKSFWLIFQSFLFVSMTLYFFTASAIGQENGLEDNKNNEIGEKTILVMGDSLSAGYGLPPGESFPDKLEEWLNDGPFKVNVINGGVSGDTSQGGNSRLEWVYSSIPNGGADLVIIEFGGNDALRGIEPALTQKNLEEMIHYLKERNVPTLLAGMLAPPNMGEDYANEFNALFPRIAKQNKIFFYPFFLDGVGGIPELNLDDGIHPNEAGIKVIVEKIGPQVASILEGK